MQAVRSKARLALRSDLVIENELDQPQKGAAICDQQQIIAARQFVIWWVPAFNKLTGPNSPALRLVELAVLAPRRPHRASIVRPGYLLSSDIQEPRASWRRIHAASDGGKPIRRRSKLSWKRLVHIPRLPSQSNKAGVSGVTIAR